MQIRLADQLVETDWQWIENKIDQYNMLQTGYIDYHPLSLFLRDTEGTIIAGLTAFTWGGTLRILFLWVHENYQRRGYGTRLLAAAEQEALTRGCDHAVVDTHSFQAPEFYPQKGYAVCGVIDDYPVGYKQIVFQKRLS